MTPTQQPIPTVTPNTPEQIERATRTICSNAANAEEAAMLLDMLGLL